MQKLPKDQRKALRFAHELMRGNYNQNYLPYVHGIILQRVNGKLILKPGYWIEPDQDPDRPFLNEATFTHLTIHGYLECQQFLPGPKWFYRLTREGCTAMSWTWPFDSLLHQNGHPTPQTRYKQKDAFRKQRNSQNVFARSDRPGNSKYYFPHRHTLYHRLHK